VAGVAGAHQHDVALLDIDALLALCELQILGEDMFARLDPRDPP